jgi:hypothetical protein
MERLFLGEFARTSPGANVAGNAMQASWVNG